MVGLDQAQEDLGKAVDHGGVVLERPAATFGDGQDPLAEGDARQDVVDQVGGRLDHAAGAATGAQIADLAGEGDQVLVLAGGAADPGKAVSQDAAAQLLAQGAFGGGVDVFGMTGSVRTLHQALRAAGVRSVLVEFPSIDHAFDLVLPQVSPVAQAATYDVERFLVLMV